jgi:hypothetical protein
MFVRRFVGSCTLLLAIASLLLFAERTARADCTTVATEELGLIGASKVTIASAQITENGKTTKLPGRECATDATCAIVYFQVSTTKPTAPPPAGPVGYVAPKAWAPVSGTASAKTCPNLFEWVVVKKPTAALAPPPAPAGLADIASPNARLIAATDAASALEAVKASRLEYAGAQAKVGTAQMDLTAAAAETLQILGQIVVDRASSKAYLLLQSKIESLLECSTKATEFPATCAAVSSLRLQDLAMAPKVLLTALAKDLVAYVGATWPGTASETLAVGIFTNAVVPIVVKPGIAQDATIRGIIDGLTSYIVSQDVSNLNPAQESVVLGVLAYAKCLVLSSGSTSSLAQCDVSAIVDQLAGKGHDASKPAARSLAGRLLSIATTTNTDKQRVQVAVDTFFDTSCMLELAVAQPVLACTDIDSITNLNTPSLASNDIAFLEAFVDGSIAVDFGRLVVVASKYVDLLQKQNAAHRKSALRLLAGLLDYGATFADSSSSQDQVAQSKLHDQRTQILESLTSDMTDRTGRGGDDIVSLGGALRLVGGVRVATNTSGTAFYGPVSLPLGIAFTHVAEGNGCGIHVQVDAFDLGNYVAFEEGPKVKSPSVADSVSPSLTIGAACGATWPFVIGPTVGYMPQFQIDPNQPGKLGAWDVGLSVGIHVPLIDLN